MQHVLSKRREAFTRLYDVTSQKRVLFMDTDDDDDGFDSNDQNSGFQQFEWPRRHSVVCIATGYWLDYQRVGVRVPIES
jgi:hypothetical protein